MTDDREHLEDERVRFTDDEVAPDGRSHGIPTPDPDEQRKPEGHEGDADYGKPDES